MSKKETGVKILVEISRIILGFTFIFSGFVKAVDPLGTAYKIEDYLAAFNLTSLSSLAIVGSVLLCVIEFAMGACMLFGLYRRWNSRLMLVVMTFMTMLTLYLAIANPVEDCGCFGDAFIISNWQTFFKNIVLLICSIIVFKYREHISNLFTGKTYWLAFLYIFIFIGLFVFRNYLYDPLFDFRPYKIGADISKLINVEEGKGREEKSRLVYAKDGVEKEFTEDNYPWEDSTWVFVRMDTKVIKEGEKPVINDFLINKLVFSPDKTKVEAQLDITQELLSDSNYVFLMVTPSLSAMDMSYLSSFEDVEYYAKDNGYGFYCLTASDTEEILRWSKENTIKFDFCAADGRMLKTMIRSNPGLILLKKGVVINKWVDIDVPAEENLTKPLTELPYGQMIDETKENKKNLIYVCCIFLFPLLLLKGFDLLFYRKRRNEKENAGSKEEIEA
jgi:uncharacterized membrane protein YphA (DoxX/SURF4 family)